MGIIDKMKDKLHIGSDNDSSTSTGRSSTAARTSTGGGQSTAGQTTAGGNTSAQSLAQGQGTTGPQGSANPTKAQTNPAAGTTSTGASSGAAPAEGATGQAVTVHERDPNWHRARELTHGAEQQSKISAAKAYEAEAFLVGAHESHQSAQDAINKREDLLAQAEAEKRNMGASDYIHREYDHAKKEIEDREKHHIEINKNLEVQQQLVGQKERELGEAAPIAAEHQKNIDNLSNKLGAVQGAKADLENQRALHEGKVRELQGVHAQNTQEVQRLETEVVRLNDRANQLEEEARAARAQATEADNKLKNLKGGLAGIAQEHDKHSRGLQSVGKDLEGHRAKEAALAGELQSHQGRAKEAADLAAAKEAELQLARQQYEAERQKGLPIEQDIERYRKQVQEKERELVEAQESSKTAEAAYNKYRQLAAEADREHQHHLSEKERKLGTYQEHKNESELANSRASEMWNAAKKHGNTGDANALQRLAEAEKQLGEEEGLVHQPLVKPNVAPKTPTSEGPKISRTENARENNEDTSTENVRTKHAAPLTN